MKKQILLFFALMAVVFQGWAQSSFTIEAPKFRGIVRVTSSNVNIRQKANAQSMRVDVAQKDEKLAVVGEAGDWYQVCKSVWIAPYAAEGGNASVQITLSGYIMKKFCENCKLQPLNSSSEMGGVYIKTSGRHKGVCLWTMYNGHEEGWSGLTFGIGKMDGNLAVLPYRIGVDGGASKRIEFKREDNGGDYKLALGSSLSEGYELDLNKLTDSDIDYLISNISKFKKTSGRIIFRTEDMAEPTDINYGGSLKGMRVKRY